MIISPFQDQPEKPGSCPPELPHTREHYARIMIDQMYQFVGLLDPKGNLLEANQPALVGAGITREEIVGRPFWQARWWAVSTEIQHQLQAAIVAAADGQFVRYEVPVYGTDAGRGQIIIDFSLTPVRDTAGTIMYLLAEGRNITEKKAVEAEVARKNAEVRSLYEQLKAFDRLKTDFFANVSHELRTPLTLILGPVRRLLADLPPAHTSHPDLTLIERNAQTLLKQVNDLLDIAKLDAGQLDLAYTVVDLPDLLRRVVAHFDGVVVDRQMTFMLHVPPVCSVELDPDKMQRTLLNLLANAFKFTPSGGTISCTVTEVGDAVEVVIEDSGPGVAPEQRATIFERFRQGESGAARRYGGTGLGLAIVREFVTLHHGTVEVAASALGGARFCIRLPRQAPAGTLLLPPDRGLTEAVNLPLDYESQTHHPGKVTVVGPADAPRVLIIEDNAEMRHFLTETLAHTYHVVAASDGATGLRMAQAMPPDAILTDMMMPDMSGDQVIAAVRGTVALHAVPVMLLTAKAEDGLRVRMLQAGANDYLVKPFVVEELRARIGNLVALKRARDTLQQAVSSQSDDLVALSTMLAARVQETQAALIAREQSHALLQAVVEALPDSIFAKDNESRYLLANIATTRFMGITPDDVLGRRDDEIWTPEVAAAILADDAAVIKHGLARTFEETLTVGERVGHFITTKVPYYDGHGRLIGLLGIARDVTEWKRAQAMLHVQERVLAAASNGIVIADAQQSDMPVIYVNPAFERISGYRAGEVLGRNCRLLQGPDTEAESIATIRAALAAQQPCQVVIRNYRRDGTPFWNELAIAPVRDEGGTVTHFVGVQTDITPQTQAMELLRQSEAHLRAIFNNSRQSYILLDQQARVLLFNGIADERATLLYGKSIEQGASIYDYAHQEWKDELARLLERALRGETTTVERQLQTVKHGRIWFAIDYAPVFADDGQVLGVCLSMLDIDERVRAMEAVVRSEERFRALVHHVSDIIVVLDTHGRMRDASPSFARTLGYHIDEMGRSSILSLIHPDDLPAARRSFRALAQPRDGSVRTQFRARHADGSWRWLESSAVNLVDHPAVGGIVATIRDVSERVRLETQVQQAQRLESVGRLAGGVAHDFNNLLTAIGGYAALVEDDLPPGSALREDMAEIVKSVERATALTRQLLIFARRQPIAPRVLDLNSVVRDVDKLLRRLLGEDVVLYLDLAPRLPSVQADAGQLEQVLVNLAINARDAMPKGGTLRISTEASPDQAGVACTVTDTGVGIPPDVQKHVFEPFFTTKAPGKGTGLGLATCYGIVEQHGGRIAITSAVGHGTTVTFNLPAVYDSLSAPVERAARPVVATGTETILLAEDESMVRALAVRILRSSGYTVYPVDNGREAVAFVTGASPPRIDLLVTDLIMPYLNGVEAAQAIVEHQPDIRVVYMTGYADHLREEMAGLPREYVLQKPFSPAQLLQTVRTMLESGQQVP